MRFEAVKYRKRDYDVDVRLYKEFTPLPYDIIKRNMERNNKSDYKTEKWFINKMSMKYYHRPDVTFFKNYPIINRFFVDFYLPAIDLIVEIDGSSHRGKEEYDQKRKEAIERAGFTVVRIQAYDELALFHTFKLFDALFEIHKDLSCSTQKLREKKESLLKLKPKPTAKRSPSIKLRKKSRIEEINGFMGTN